MKCEPRAVPMRVASTLVVALALASGCGGGNEQLESDLAALEQRVSELERSSGRYQTQLNGLEEDVLLLEDRVEAHRLSLERRGTVQVRSRDELPVYRPPQAAPDHSYLTELPVQRLTPPEQAAPSEPDDLQELVITNETLAEFVEEHGGAAPASYGPSGRSLPPVVVGDRLPGRDGATPRPAASTPATSTVAARPAATAPGTASLDGYQAALALFNEGSYQEARQGFVTFLASGPPVDYEDNALFWIGECHYALGDYPGALEHFERVVRDYPDGNKVPDSLLKIGLTYEQLNAPDRATEVLSGLVETFPSTDAARRASERLAELR